MAAARAASCAKALEALAAVNGEEAAVISAAAVGDPGARPFDEERLARMRPASAVDAADMIRGVRGRPRLAATEHLVSLRLDPDVVERFRATGPRWRSRINNVLRAHCRRFRGRSRTIDIYIVS
jgi:uncharacterized protein (DUF4415 family)